MMKHGFLSGMERGRKPPEYDVWRNMRRRCTDKTNIRFDRYGGRGVKVCDRWKDFAAFFADMGFRPSPHHTIERLDNDAGYEPGNCVWATKTAQARNRKTNRMVEFEGAVMPLAEAAERAGIPYVIVRARFYRLGWPLLRCLTQPHRLMPRHKC